MQTIIVKEGESIIQTVHLKDKTKITIGADNDRDIVLDNILVSPHHAEIVKRDDAWIFKDTGSDDGSFKDGMRIQEHVLENGDEIQIANFVLYYDSGFLSEEETETKVVYEESQQKQKSDTNKVPKLLARDQEGKNLEYLIVKTQTIIGRGLGADIIIEDITISRMHAKIIMQNGKFYLKDLDSRNGTFLNKNKISFAEIVNGDVVTFGTYSTKFVV